MCIDRNMGPTMGPTYDPSHLLNLIFINTIDFRVEA